jgi:mono/diheme cytochrome c family protein
MNLFVVLAVVAAMIVLKIRRAGLLAWALAWWAGFFVVVRYGFTVPIPVSVIAIYMMIVTLALLAYVTSSTQRREDVTRPLVRLMVEPGLRPLLILVVVALPTLAAAGVYARMKAPIEAPFFSRTVHPASPSTVSVHEKTIDLDTGGNPFRALETSNPEDFRRHVEHGRQVYYENCFFCHGDDMRGNGMFIHGLNPIPTNFTDKGTIAMLRETFLFWRVSKGGPGLPEEGGPWDSAMPTWEKFLKEDDMWDAVLFLYDFTGQKPRAAEAAEKK